MANPDINNLRALLDEYELFADTISETPARRPIAREMRDAIAEARRGLLPSPDGTANFVESKLIVERLAAIRKEAEAA